MKMHEEYSFYIICNNERKIYDVMSYPTRKEFSLVYDNLITESKVELNFK